jgi:hypothetical protein
MMQRIAVVAFALVTLVGCRQSETVPVTGTVTLNGQPAADAEVIFTPSKGRVASGATDAAGRFTLSTNQPGDGAVPGDHKVTVVEYYPPGKPPPMTSKGPPSRFPQQYMEASQTPLEAKVERGGKNDFTFDIKK